MSLSKRIVATALLLAPACLAAEIACPAFQDKRPLANVSVFDGPPEEHADLVPDSSTGKAANAVSTWEVGYIFDAGRKLFLVCQYAGTGKTATIKAETKVERCIFHAPGKERPASLTCK